MKPHDFNNNHYTYTWSQVSALDQVRVEKLVEMAGTGNKVLDIGCMDGSIGSRIKTNGNTVYGIDISAEAVKFANAKGLIAKVGDIETRWDFEDSTFDVVIAGEVIEHLYDPDHFLEEIHRVLKPTGRVVLTTPNIATLSRRFKFLRGIDPGLEYSLRHENSVGHIRFFLKSTLENLIERRQFKILRMRSDVVQFGPVKSRRMGDWIPSFGKSFIAEAQPIK